MLPNDPDLRVLLKRITLFWADLNLDFKKAEKYSRSSAMEYINVGFLQFPVLKLF